MQINTPYIIGITGGSGSGKTTLASIIAKNVNKATSLVLSEDNYYLDHSRSPGFNPTDFNFDDISAREHDLLYRDLNLLKERKSIMMPEYDFSAHIRKIERIKTAPSDIIIVEGIHILFKKSIRSLLDLKIYVDVPDDIRLLRRLARDVRDRGRTVDDVIDQYLTTVRPMHYKYTFPTKKYADFIFEPKIFTGPLAEEELVMLISEKQFFRELFSLENCVG